MKTSQLSVLKRIDGLLARASSRAAAGNAASANRSFSGPGGVAPSDLTGTTTAPIVVAAMDLTPTSSGFFLAFFVINYTLSAADIVTWDVQGVPSVTAITGGEVFNENFHYESGTPLVVTGGTPNEMMLKAQTIAAGDIGHVATTLAGLVVLPQAGRQAIVLRATTAGGAHLTAINVTAYASEQLP